jgi:signal transduction histidine kinase
MRLAEFISTNVEPILSEWETFARDIWPEGADLDVAELRDHAGDILRATIADMQTYQSAHEQSQKSKGLSDDDEPGSRLDSASDLHGLGRVRSGFDLMAVVAEYRALRASVIRLWAESDRDPDAKDLQDLTRFNESMDQSLAQAVRSFTEEVERSRRMFLGILGHDLRNPLNAMSLIAQSMSRAHLDDGSRSMMAQFSQSAAAMSRMIKDLLDFTQAGLGAGMPLTPASLDLKNLCEEVVGEMRAAHPSRRFLFSHQGDLRGTWDGGRLRQVISNLLANAVQHGTATGLVALNVSDEGPTIHLGIHNEGPPIPASALPTIFEPFVQSTSAQPQAQRRSGSIGLGLYIAREVVKAHGGSIEVQSTDQGGTTFTVRLPRESAGG